MRSSIADKYNYSAESVMAQRMIFSAAMLCLYPTARIITSEPVGVDIDGLSEEQRGEIYDFARSYTDKMLITGDESGIFVLCPTLFPASSLCPVLKIHIPPSEFLRAVQQVDSKMFEMSSFLKVTPSRLSRAVRGHIAEVEALCNDLKECFTRLPVVEDIDGSEVIRRCLGLSRFVGCPVWLEAEDGFEDTPLKNVELPLLCAFVTDMLLLARSRAPKRSAVIKFKVLYDAPLVEISFSGDFSMCALDQYYEWKNIANERDMHIYLYEDGGSMGLSMHFYRIDPALLGLKAPVMLRQSTPRWMT